MGTDRHAAKEVNNELTAINGGPCATLYQYSVRQLLQGFLRF